MPTESMNPPSKTGAKWLATAYLTVIVVLFLGLVIYREYFRYYYPREIDPLSQWLFIANRTWALVACGLLAIGALVLEWRGYRANGNSSLFASFPSVALLTAVAILFVYTAYGT